MLQNEIINVLCKLQSIKIPYIKACISQIGNFHVDISIADHCLEDTGVGCLFAAGFGKLWCMFGVLKRERDEFLEVKMEVILLTIKPLVPATPVTLFFRCSMR